VGNDAGTAVSSIGRSNARNALDIAAGPDRPLLRTRQIPHWAAKGGKAMALRSLSPAALPRPPRAVVQFGLLAATLITTTWAGAAHRGIDLLASPGAWTAGLPYALALLAILGVHEMGHYVVARRRRVDVTLPYFVPAPFWLGTFGAFIRMRGPVRDRTTYFDVGLAGPVAGLVVALAALWLGLRLTPPTAVVGHGISPHASMLVAGVYHLAGADGLRETVVLGPVAFAGWLGLVVTALNLLPVGQLDGGHIAYGLLGPTVARRLSLGFLALLAVGGLVLGAHLWMWGLLAWAIAGIDHPPAADERTPVSGPRVVAGVMAAVLLAVILLPLPWAA